MISQYKFALTVFLFFVHYACFAQVFAGEGYSGTSVNTAVFRNSPLCTFGTTQYISYYDSEGYVVVGKRQLSDTTFTIQRTQYKGNIRDGHNVISICVDGEGYLHVAFDHHNNRLHYARSVEPGSLALTEQLSMVGDDEDKVTYPEFYRLNGGNLLFAYRSGKSGSGNLVMNIYDVRTHRWQRLQDVLIDGEGERNAYWQLYVDKRGTIHLSWVWRESWLVETNHDICYACSHDNGKTWQRTDGTTYTLPITAGNAEYAWRVPQNSELINQTSMSADAKGRPYIATYWRDGDGKNQSEMPQYRIVFHDGKGWRTQQVSERTQTFSLKGGGTKMIPIARPRILVDGRKAWLLFRDEERGSKVSVYTTADINKAQWEVSDLTDYPVNAWEPTIDVELWKDRRLLDVFVQNTYQGDCEKALDSNPTMVSVVSVNAKRNAKR